MNKFNLTKKACYISSLTMSISANLSPLLFLTFREMYGLSYTLLGLLVVINFLSQLLVDLIFTFFTKYFNVKKTVKMTPFIVFVGLMIYALLPKLFPDMSFCWIVIGTVIFSVASGLNEVLLSPVIAAIPSDNPESEMSKLHSMYAWGVVGVVIVSTLFLFAFGTENWTYLALLLSIVPLIAFFTFLKAEFPEMQNFGAEGKSVKIFNKGIILCVICIFCGGAAECTMSQWASGFIENAMGVPKVYGDVIGVATFALLLGTGRTLYSKYGKNVINFLFYGMLGSSVAYVVASLSLNNVVGVIACAATGIFTSMLWPGTLIFVEEKFKNVGVAIYALMAAGGDMGASVGPQLVGIISDKFKLTNLALDLSRTFNVSTEQVSMRAGLLVAGLFSVIGVVTVAFMKRYFKNQKTN